MDDFTAVTWAEGKRLSWVAGEGIVTFIFPLIIIISNGKFYSQNILLIVYRRIKKTTV